jgi:septal ring factor EnvC (AmiA/AmiB activator)
MKTKIQILFVLLLFATCSLSAQSTRTKSLENQRNVLLIEINNTNQLLSENKKSTGNLLNRLSLIAQQIIARRKLVEVLAKEMKELNQEIALKERQIADLEKNLQQKKENYAASVRKIYRNKNNQDQLLFILSADDFAQSFRRILYLKKYTNWQQKQAEDIVVEQNRLNQEKEILEKNKKEKEILAGLKKNEEQELQKEESSKKTEVANLQKNAKKLQADLAKKQKQAATLNKEIEKIIKEEVAAANKAATTQPNTQRKAATTGGYAMTREEQALSANFESNRGKLPFPLKGNYKIVGRFGQQRHENVKNVVINNNGIEIETTAGNMAKAVFDGVVTRVFVLPGFQTSVIVRHGNYLTLYSYLDQVIVKQGDKVKTGQDLGRIYTDKEKGNSTVLHFELWKEQSKLNPEPWLYK